MGMFVQKRGKEFVGFLNPAHEQTSSQENAWSPLDIVKSSMRLASGNTRHNQLPLHWQLTILA